MPSKFGIKFWLLCDVKTSYVFTAMPYIGKEEHEGVRVSEHVVLQLMDPFRKNDLNVITDNYFTSLSLVPKNCSNPTSLSSALSVATEEKFPLNFAALNYCMHLASYLPKKMAF